VKKTLVAGMGNLLRGDDGFGVRVIERLSTLGMPAGVELYEAGGAGIALAQKLMDGYEACILVDATLRQGSPGTLYRLEPRVTQAPVEIGMHNLDPFKALVLAQALGCCPPHVVVIGCEPQNTEELCEELSAPVSAAVDRAVEMILRELERLR
jgi:hydrogenase maturation protease